ncbi:hypothetical protein PN36_23715 [Candidatus Thiomargarita nelsonii]|uniref:Uncharacterized protein n=1 Tax=Candidatus Thiomargarita nelsonii TaxID=1003181 RepID=A0A4E0RFS8_9GAMM|nr:hypothetical protein PN36_23715 [Candidatus Thiomargarita nelsonii]
MVALNLMALTLCVGNEVTKRSGDHACQDAPRPATRATFLMVGGYSSLQSKQIFSCEQAQPFYS